MATKKKSTLKKVGEAVQKATQSVAETADEYVVTPVSKALGVGGKKKTAKKPAAKKKSAASSSKAVTAKKSTARKTTTKKTAAKKK